jgi:hypothetical protein
MTYYPNIPDGCTGFILGKEADRLRHLMHSTGTFIDKADAGTLPKFVISGLPDDVDKAKKMIDFVIDGTCCLPFPLFPLSLSLFLLF